MSRAMGLEIFGDDLCLLLTYGEQPRDAFLPPRLATEATATMPLRREINVLIGEGMTVRAMRASILVRTSLGRSKPRAIAGTIAEQAIEAIDLVARTGTRPHVLEECDERFSPPLANANALRAVPTIVLVVGILAAPDDPGPDFVLWRPAHAVRRHPLRVQFVAETAA